MDIRQKGEDCVVTVYSDIRSDIRTVKNCNALKLARTLWDKSGEKYSIEEMSKFGFELKK